MRTAIQVIGKCIYAFFFLALLIIPISLTNTTEKVKSSFDNRELIGFPEIGETDFEEKVESYLHDRIGLRDELITGYQLVNEKVTGELTHPSYTYGKEGYIFFPMHDNYEFGSYQQLFANTVVKMNLYCKERNIPFIFVFDPEKTSVYRRYLSNGVNYNDEWADDLIAFLEEHGVKAVDNKKMLLDTSYTENVFNQKYDAGHWNDLGCFYGTNNLWKAVHEEFSSVTEYLLDEFDIRMKMEQFLPQSKFPVNEEVPSFSLKTEWRDITNRYDGIKLNDHFQYIQYYVNTSEQAKNYPRILAFHGSYYNRGPQFLVGRSSEYIGIHAYQNVLDIDYYFNLFQPDLVVFEAAEYAFGDTYYDAERMKQLQLNPGLHNSHQETEKTIKQLLLESETIEMQNDNRIILVPGDGFDTIYYGTDLPSIQYAYCFSSSQIFDLKKSDYGGYAADLPQNFLDNRATLYLIDQEGRKFNAPLNVYIAQLFSTSKSVHSTSSGVKTSGTEKVFSTTINNNHFNSIAIQLYDVDTNKYVALINSNDNLGKKNGSFIHCQESGWYRLRLMANSNMQDESIDYMVYLEKGKEYYFSYSIEKMTEKEITIKDFGFYGLYKWNETEELINPTDNSEKEERKYELYTDLKDNMFNSVVLQFINDNTAIDLEPVSIVADSGEYRGFYLHTSESGSYYIRLRANSNLRDEYIGFHLFLQNGELYRWRYNVESIDPQNVVVSDFSFALIQDADS